MKKRVKSLNMNVMLGLLAVLFISLGYLSMQGKQGFRGSREGFREGLTPEEKKTAEAAEAAKTKAKMAAKIQADCMKAGGAWNSADRICE
jgi:hypothetical protein